MDWAAAAPAVSRRQKADPLAISSLGNVQK